MEIRTSRGGFSESFKIFVVTEIEAGRLTQAEASRKYNILGHSTVLKWCRKYGHLKHACVPKPKGSVMVREAHEILRLNNEIKALKRELEDARTKNVVMETFVDIAEKELGIPIRKKIWCQTVREVKRRYPQLKIAMVSRLFGKSRQAFHQMEKRRQHEYIDEEFMLVYVAEIRKRQPRIGTRKLYSMLKEVQELNNIKIGRDKFFRLLRKHDLLIKPRRKRINTTDSNHAYTKYPNLIKEFIPRSPEQIWASDITYLQI